MRSLTKIAILAALLVAVVAAAAAPSNAATSYTTAAGVDYLRMSYAAYCGSSSVVAWNCKWCQSTSTHRAFRPTQYIYAASTDTRGYVGVNEADDTIIVAFRGSVNLENWITNLKVAQLYTWIVPGARVHYGFAEAYTSVVGQVRNAVAALQASYPSAKLVFIGHSLGGALATLAAADLASKSPVQAELWTFGCPRVGDIDFVSWMATQALTTYRVVNSDDIVPHLPPAALFFHHVAREVWLPTEGSTAYQLCDYSGEDENCSDSLLLPISVTAHNHYYGLQNGCSSSVAADALREAVPANEAAVEAALAADAELTSILRADREVLAARRKVAVQ